MTPSRLIIARKYSPSIALVMLLLLITCTTKNTNSLKAFVQNDNRALVEVVDQRGELWKILSLATGTSTTTWVANSNDQVEVMALVFTNKTGARLAVVYTDSSAKEPALAVLDRTFLFPLAKASDDYKNWLAKGLIFNYGSVEEVRIFNLAKGSLGKGHITVDPNNKIVAQMAHLNCSCDGGAACGLLDPITIKCVNAMCAVANCIIDVFNGQRGECNNESSTANQWCGLRVNAPD